jgi:hypothetical protein
MNGPATIPPGAGQLTPQPSDWNRNVINQQPVALRHDEQIRWDCELWDSDGYQHGLAALSSHQAVTRRAGLFAVWDRRTGLCLSHQGGASEEEPYVLGNFPLTAQQRKAREEKLLEALRLPANHAGGSPMTGRGVLEALAKQEAELAPDAPAAFLPSCTTVERLLNAAHAALRALPEGDARRQALADACTPFRDGVAAAFYTRGDMIQAHPQLEGADPAQLSKVELAAVDAALANLVDNFPHPWDQMSTFFTMELAARDGEDAAMRDRPAA